MESQDTNAPSEDPLDNIRVKKVTYSASTRTVTTTIPLQNDNVPIPTDSPISNTETESCLLPPDGDKRGILSTTVTTTRNPTMNTLTRTKTVTRIIVVTKTETIPITNLDEPIAVNTSSRASFIPKPEPDTGVSSTTSISVSNVITTTCIPVLPQPNPTGSPPSPSPQPSLVMPPAPPTTPTVGPVAGMAPILPWSIHTNGQAIAPDPPAEDPHNNDPPSEVSPKSSFSGQDHSIAGFTSHDSSDAGPANDD
ncbi:hypothetical protein F4803DRAFT_556510 [Xylaria telfairii]|nr:hypothetical protein F4803DRAFT_556510 [Xylaria telfairii]